MPIENSGSENTQNNEELSIFAQVEVLEGETLVEASARLAETKAANIAKQFKNRPSDLLNRAHKRYSQIREHALQVMTKSAELGFDLMAMRTIFGGYGQWEPSLKQIGISSRQQAQRYINLARGWHLVGPAIQARLKADSSLDIHSFGLMDCLRFIEQSKATPLEATIEEPIVQTKRERKARRNNYGDHNDLVADSQRARSLFSKLCYQVHDPFVQESLALMIWLGIQALKGEADEHDFDVNEFATQEAQEEYLNKHYEGARQEPWALMNREVQNDK